MDNDSLLVIYLYLGRRHVKEIEYNVLNAFNIIHELSLMFYPLFYLVLDSQLVVF